MKDAAEIVLGPEAVVAAIVSRGTHDPPHDGAVLLTRAAAMPGALCITIGSETVPYVFAFLDHDDARDLARALFAATGGVS